ncbi:pyrroline-5-carboxylate reductase [Limosilactobacillus coleohominis 101-4-CHN]|uniref:Pyrroline-5-carboxylate reductase n=2 Tax=Limosilactobacillus coleohominis TaxID=181675 RepID=C7XV52_9LACO|nr:pyrroline-5-carboxylate reductase [Limosilactobacillus coleohominis 101-4-CHN]
MNKMKIGVIGAGNMGTAMIEGWLNAGQDTIAVMNPQNPRVTKFCAERQLSLFHHANEMMDWQPDVLLLTTPASRTLNIINDFYQLPTKVVMISAAAGISLQSLEKVLPNNPWIRIIPNIPVSVNAGTIGLALGSNTDHSANVISLIEQLGQVITVPEDQLNIVGTIGGCGPAFIDVIMDALGDAAVKHGLNRKTANELAASMVAGTGKLALEAGLSPAELRDQVTSPGGTTIRGVEALEKHRVRYAMMDAVDQASQN